MTSIRRLMRSADPAAEPRVTELSERARAELEALVGTTPPRRTRRLPLILLLAAAAAVVVAVAAVAIFGGTAQPPTADQPYFESTQALEDRADLIVRGVILSTRRQDPETLATISVGRTAKGQVAPGTRLEISYVTSGPETAAGLAEGREYVFLLETFPSDPAVLVNTTQGYYTVSDGRAVPGPDNDVRLSTEVKRALGVQ